MKQAEDKYTMDLLGESLTPKKYRVTVVFSLVQTIEVEADGREEAKQTAWDLFDQNEAVVGEGEVLEVQEVTQ
jgi:hypothetical protein